MKGLAGNLARWPMILMAIGLLAGIAVGFGTVEAALVTYQVDEGVAYYPGPGATNMTILRMSNHPENFPNHAYKQRWKLDADDDFPGATEVEFLNGWYRGYGTPSGTTCFWRTTIFTEETGNSETTWNWARDQLTNAYNEAFPFDWHHDDFNGNNYTVSVEQVMVVPYTGDTCSTGAGTSPPPIHHVTTWEVY